MVYFANIPQPGDRPSDSQNQILQNFQTLDTVFAVDHIPFSITDNSGKHKQITFDTNHPAPLQTGTQSVLYTKNVGGNPALFWRNAIAEQPISPNAGGIFAWCTWNGTLPGANPPISGYNVASITYNGVGDYTITYINPLVSGLPGATFIFGQVPGISVMSYLVSGGPTLTRVQFESSPSTPIDVNFGNFIILGS